MDEWPIGDDTTDWWFPYFLLDDMQVEERGYMDFSRSKSDAKPPIPNMVIIPTMASSVAAAASTGRQAGSKGYSRAEMNCMLDIIERILPVGNEEWDQVVQEHLLLWPQKNRDANSIRRKLAALHRKNIPTGDPNCPPEVKQAKRIKYLIGRRCDIGDGEELYELQANAFSATERQRTDAANLGIDTDDENPPSHQPSQEDEEELAVAAGAPRATQVEETPQAASALNVSSFSSARNTVRPYQQQRRNREQEHQEYMDMMKMKLQRDEQEREQRKEEREEDCKQRQEDRQMFIQSMSAFMGAVGSYLGSKKRKRRDDSDSD